MSEKRIVTVSGSGHGAGKTALVERLARGFAGCGAVKVRPEEDLPPEVAEEADSAQNPRKDTGRMLAAGAARVWLVQGPVGHCVGAVRGILDEPGYDTLLVETNALVEELDPDLAFYVRGPGEPKPGAAEVRDRADVIVSSETLIEPREE